MTTNRISASRRPTRLERLMLKGRMVGRKTTFANTWKEYLAEEQELMDMIVRREEAAIAKDKAAGRVIYDLDDVLECLDNIAESLECTAMKAMRMFLREQEPTARDREVEAQLAEADRRAAARALLECEEAA